jgi:TolB-like protein
MAAGRRPFPGPNATSFAAQIVHEAPAKLSGGAKSVPGELTRIIFRLLEKKPEARYPTAKEVYGELNKLARDLELGKELAAEIAEKTSVAVLPFKLLTPNSEDEYLAVAFADPAIHRLGASHELLVRPISAVMRYAKGATDPSDAARELNVRIVVDGSVQKIGQRLRVHVQAWDARENAVRISAKFDADVTELFDLQDRVADELARTLSPDSPRRVVEAPPTKNTVAYELFLRAMDRMTRNNRWDTRTAIEMLENATQLDPQFADAWGGLAEACVVMGVTFEPGPKWITRSERAVQRALKLDPENVEAHQARGRLFWTPARKFQNAPALRALRRALTLRPNHHHALRWQGCVLLHVGLLAEARECLYRALAVGPDDTFTLVFLGQTALYEGHYEEGHELYARALSIDRANLWANLFSPHAPLYSNQLNQAEETIRAASQVLPKDPLLISSEALLWAKRGEKRKAEQLAKKAPIGGRSLSHTHHMMHTLAATYAVLGKPAPALAWLRKASMTGLPAYPAFRDDPHFDSLHNDPSFLRLMSAIKKEWMGYAREFGSKSGNRV